MKSLCLVYLEEQKLHAVPDSECFACGTGLRNSGILIAAEALQPVETATTVRLRHGKVSITDGPFAETKEQLAGFYLIEARDLNDAIQVASKNPAGARGKHRGPSDKRARTVAGRLRNELNGAACKSDSSRSVRELRADCAHAMSGGGGVISSAEEGSHGHAGEAIGTDRAPHGDLVELLSRKIVGQSNALQFIIPYLRMYQAGLSAPDRPAGIFLLLGPTGTGKTRTVEALAEILHGSNKNLLKIDCAEYQSDHEVAKLLGAPPGYVGHRETKPMLTQERLLDVVSNDSDLALVLFDEIEKAAPALTTLLLGMLDKATLRLGDNTSVNFEKTLIFLTSNVGAREMLKEMHPDIGFQPPTHDRRPTWGPGWSRSGSRRSGSGSRRSSSTELTRSSLINPSTPRRSPRFSTRTSPSSRCTYTHGLASGRSTSKSASRRAAFCWRKARVRNTAHASSNAQSIGS